jgi:DNA-directed RNA polymerase specialized sigma24 family protein
MPETLQKTEETLETEAGLEEVSRADELQANALADTWQLSRAPRDLWPALEKTLETESSGDRGRVPPRPPVGISASSAGENPDDSDGVMGTFRLRQQGLSVAEIAAEQNLTEATVQARIHRAEVRIRRATASPTQVNGEQTDFETFQKIYERRVFRVAATLTGDLEAAHDLTLDVFLHLWRVWNDLRPGTRHWTFLNDLTQRLYNENRLTPPPDHTAELLAELKALRGELSSLRREVSELRRTQKPGYAPSATLMPYVRADDRALPLG